MNEPDTMAEVRATPDHYLELARQCRDMTYEQIEDGDPLDLTNEVAATIFAMHEYLENLKRGTAVIIPHTREHAEAMQLVADACLADMDKTPPKVTGGK